MRKIIFITLALLFAFSVFTCDDKDKPEDTPPPPAPTLDQRLVGGRWYFPEDYAGRNSLTSKASEGYYQFTADGKFIYSYQTTYNQIIGDTLSGKSVYSSNDIVYYKDTNKKAIQFSFPSKFPYQSPSSLIYPATGNEYSTLNFLASKGDLITYSLFDTSGNLYEVDYPAACFLVRFKEDGTQYDYN